MDSATYAAAELAYRQERLTGRTAGEPVHHVRTARPRLLGQLRERLNRGVLEAARSVRARHRDHLASNRVAPR